jgi:glycosyltransferase involved in cell wall biosynthesis
MVSALIASKRVADGVRAVSKIPGAHLVVAGDGPLRDEIGALTKSLLPGRFSRISVTPDRMPALYRSADVFLHLSKDESFGNVYLESMACGIPVVAHDIPRVRWIVGDDEYLSDTDHIEAVTRSIEAAAQASPALIPARVQRAAEFSWAKVASKYLAFFEQVIAAGKKGQSGTE